MSDANGFDYPLMARALILGDKDTVARKTREGLDLSMDPKDLIFRGLIPGMDVVGEKFRRNEYYVPQVLLSARAMYAGLDLLKPLITQTGSGSQSLGVVVIGTAQGDLHDIGKNLVAMMLEGAGFKVINLGRDVAPEKFVAAVKEHDAQIVGISALMTTTMPAIGGLAEEKVVTRYNDDGLPTTTSGLTWYTADTMRRYLEHAVDNCRRIKDGRELTNVVNR